jgi:hypothetical protein
VQIERMTGAKFSFPADPDFVHSSSIPDRARIVSRS